MCPKNHFLSVRLGIVAFLLAASFLNSHALAQTTAVLQDSIRPVESAPATGTANPHRAYISRKTLASAESSAPMVFEVALKMRNFSELQARVNRGDLISPAEMAAKYEPLASDYQAVANWMTSRGFKITRQSQNHLAIFASGKVSQIGQALQVNFARVTAGGKEFTSAITAPSVPSTLAPLLVGINGLQPHIRMHKHIVKPAAAGGAAPYTPSQIAQAYQATGLYNTGITGVGQSIAIVIDTFPSKDDLISFWSGYGINQSINNIDFIQAVPGTNDATTGEETLDTEWSSSIAPGAKVRVYAATDLGNADLDQAYQQVYDDVTAHPEFGIHQMSMSYGEGEIETTNSQMQTDDNYFVELANAGVTIFASSGDEGSTPGQDDQGNPTETGYLEAESPASDPNVIGVGGTTLTLNSSNNESSEVVWNNSIGASGGGTSIYFGRPSWQTGVGTGTMRLVPDIACTADPNYGADIVYQAGATVSGGTSWSSPTCAGFCALINQARANLGLPALGQGGALKMAARIYPLIGTANFRDITSGSNATPASGGKYAAQTGYDEATGIGVPLVQTLAETLAGTQTLLGVAQQTPIQTVYEGQNATISVTASGGPVGYQWQRMPVGNSTWSNLSDNSVYSGSATATLTVTNATPAMSGDQFQCVVSYSGVSPITSNQPCVLMVEIPWSITTLAGGANGITGGLLNGTGTASEFNYPTGVAVDSSGNLYIADCFNNVIRKVTLSTSNGVVTATVTTPYGSLSGANGSGSKDGSGNSATFYNPRDIAIDSSNNLYVSDESNGTIRKIVTGTSQVTTIAGTPPPATSILSEPKGIAVDNLGNVYVADYGNNVIRKIATNGAVSILAGSSTFQAGYQDGPASQALFNQPIGLAVDSSKNVYVTEYGNYDVRKISSGGVVSTLAGQAGVAGCLDGTGTQALFNVPRGIMVDSSGNLYVTDSVAPVSTPPPEFSGNNLLRKITPAGVVSTLAGLSGAAGNANGNGPAAQFYNPCGLAMHGSTLYIADASNNTIRAGTLDVIGATITLSSSPVNAGTLTGAGTFNVGNSQTVTATANADYTFANWTQNGAVVSTSASYTFTLTANVTLVANFTGSSAITSGPSATFVLGKAGSFTFTATGGRTFSATGLPSWAHLNPATGVLTGTPQSTTGAPFTVNLTATNGTLPNAIQTFTLNVQPAQAFSGNPTAMPENDGIPNLLKYVYDINSAVPMSATDYAALPTSGMTTIGGTQYLTLTYRQNVLQTGVTINVQTSSDMKAWTTVANPTITQIGNDSNTTNGDPILQAQVPLTGTKEFIRLDVTTP